MGLGLKDYKIKHECRFIINFKDFCYELKWAFQRFWRGYDDMYLFNLDSKLDELIPEILKWLRYNRSGSPVLTTEETCHEDWNNVLDEILYHFKESNEETCSEKNEFTDLMGFNFEYEKLDNGMTQSINKDDPEIRNKWLSRSIEIDKYNYEHRKEAYMLIAKNIDSFWD